MSVAHNIEDKERTEDVNISEKIDFNGLLLSPPVLEGLAKSGFKRPSPIQLEAIPLGRCGLDLIVQAKSGTGKTCVFTVIALEGLTLHTDALQVLILAPTREIAVQIREVVNSIGSCMPELKCHSFIGGTSVQQDKISLKRCHVATGTPGRIKQLIELGIIKTQSIRLFVLDEADKLLGGDLTDPINWIYSSLPDNKQILALSATYPEAVAQHLTRYMRNPTFVRLNITDPALIGIKQYHVIVPDSPLPNKVFKAKTEAVIQILSSVSFEQCLIFSNLQTRAQGLQSELQSRNWPTQCIAGCLDQKDRSMAMEHLKAYKCRILISTDLTSRGIDADKVNMVINLDVPLDHETYLHRIGRAGRFGSHGAAISIVSKGKQERELWAVERKCKTKIPKLPDPIPSDLATRYVALKLSDVVTTERIITHADSTIERFAIIGPDQSQIHASSETALKATTSGSSAYDGNSEREVQEVHNVDDGVRRETSKGRGDGGEDRIANNWYVENGASSKNLDIDSCNSVREGIHLGKSSSSEVLSVGNDLDVCRDDGKTELYFSKTVNDCCVSFSRQTKLVSDESEQQLSEVLYDSTRVNNVEDVSKIENSSNRTDDVSLCERKGNAKNCISLADKNEEDKSAVVVPDKRMESPDRQNEASRKINSLGDSLTVSRSPPRPNKADSCTTVKECVKASLSHAPCANSKESVVMETATANTRPSSSRGKVPVQAAQKPARQKHPRPFALSAFLKGLTENSFGKNECDAESIGEPKGSSDGLENDKKCAGNEMKENGGKEDAMTETGIHLEKKLKEFAIHTDSVNGGDPIQCVNRAVPEPAVERTGACRETDEKPLQRVENGKEESFHPSNSIPGRETFAPDKCKNSNSNDESDLLLVPKSSRILRTFSEIQKDFENFSLSPREVCMEDICHSISDHLSEMNLQSCVGSGAVRFEQCDFSKLSEIKRDIKEMVAKTKLERMEKPEIVQDFVKKTLSTKSAELLNGNVSGLPQPSSLNKSGKRKKWGGVCNTDVQNWRKRGSDSTDWRSADKHENIPGSDAVKDKGFDDLLREQQTRRLQEKKEKRIPGDERYENKNSVEHTKSKCHDAENEIRHVEEKTAPMVAIPKIEHRVEAISSSTRFDCDNSDGSSRPKSNQRSGAIDSSSVDDATKRVTFRGTPDQECQMLDQMHLEMLRKRKERKEQAAKLKQLAASSERIASSEKTVNCSKGEPMTRDIITDQSIDNKEKPHEENVLEKGEWHSGQERNLPSGDVELNAKEECIEVSTERNDQVKMFSICQDVSEHISRVVSSEASTANNKIESSESDKLLVEDSVIRGPVLKGGIQIHSFMLKGLDLSSDSDNLQVSTSSYTEVTDISSCSDSKSSNVARQLKFAERKWVTKYLMPEPDYKIERKLSKPVTRRLPNPNSPNSKNVENKKPSKKLSAPVRNLSRLSSKNSSHKPTIPKDLINFNVSNNEDRCGQQAFSAYNSINHGPTTTRLFSSTQFDLEGRPRLKLPKGNNQSSDSNARTRRRRRCHQSSTAEGLNATSEQNASTFDSSTSSVSPNNWWPYWTSLYHHYINSSSLCENFFMPHNSPYHYYQDYQRQHYPISMGPPPLQPYCNYHHHHQTSPWYQLPHRPDDASFTTADAAMGYQHYHNYSHLVASLQQKYVRHMARVMQEMSSHYFGDKQ